MKTEHRSRALCRDFIRVLTAKRSLKGFQACGGRFPSPSLWHLRDLPSANIKNTRTMQENKLLDITGSYWWHKRSLVLFSHPPLSVTIYSAIYLTCACARALREFLHHRNSPDKTPSPSTANARGGFSTPNLINQWQSPIHRAQRKPRGASVFRPGIAKLQLSRQLR